jgi:hypothetical protein
MLMKHRVATKSDDKDAVQSRFMHRSSKGRRMHAVVRVIAWLFCLPALVLWLSGCAGGQSRLADRGNVRIENPASGKVHVAWSDVREERGGLLVTGVLDRSDTVGLPIKTRVEVEVVSSSGSILNTAQSDAVSVARRSVNRVQGFERFAVRLPSLPPAGSTIRVVTRAG